MVIEQNDGQVRTLAEWRKLALLTQEELAKQIGVKTTTVRAWEQGRNMPRMRWQRGVAEYLGVRPAQIVYPAKDKRRPHSRQQGR